MGETREQVERRNRWFQLALEMGAQDDFLAMLAHERQMMPAPRWDQLPNRHDVSVEIDDIAPLLDREAALEGFEDGSMDQDQEKPDERA